MKQGSFIFWSIFTAAAIFRVATSFSAHAPDASACLKHADTGIGTISEDPARNETGQTLIVAVDSVLSSATSTKPCAVDILVRMKTKTYPRFSYGDRVKFSGKISTPFNFTSNNGRVFDYKGYLAKDDVYYEIKSAVIEKTTTENSGTGIIKRITSALFLLKRRFVTNLEKVLGEPHAALASGLVVGEKASLGKDLLNDFRIVGLIHIVVLSGFNITIVAVALRRILSFLPRVWGIVFSSLAIVLFGILVGGGATVIRSCFMAGIALIADLIRRDYSVHRALGFAALVMLIQSPMILLHDPSFQLSFLATVGLILLAGPIENKLGFVTEKFGIRGTIAATLSTQIFVSPFILYTMGQISIIGVIVNILVLPFIPVTMLAVFLTGATGFILPFVSQFFAWSTHILLSYELFMVENFARLPFAAAYLPPFSIWWVVGFYAVLVGGYFLILKRTLSHTL